MRWFGIVALGLAGFVLIAIVGVFAWLKINYPTYTYRYRLTITMEVDRQVHTGSSVIEVIWKGGPEFGDVGPYHPRTYGQAVFVDLGPRGAVVATLHVGDTSRDLVNGPRDAVWIGARAFGNLSSNQELPDLPRLSGRRSLAANNMPRLIWLPNVSDPTTARRLLPEDIPTLFGPTARLADAFVEITRDPVIFDIDKRLPWFQQLAREQKTRGVLQRPDEFKLIHNMFIGD